MSFSVKALASTLPYFDLTKGASEPLRETPLAAYTLFPRWRICRIGDLIKSLQKTAEKVAEATNVRVEIDYDPECEGIIAPLNRIYEELARYGGSIYFSPPHLSEKREDDFLNSAIIAEYSPYFEPPEELTPIQEAIANTAIFQNGVLKMIKNRDAALQNYDRRPMINQILKFSSNETPAFFALTDYAIKRTCNPPSIRSAGEIIAGAQFGLYANHVIQYRRHLLNDKEVEWYDPDNQ